MKKTYKKAKKLTSLAKKPTKSPTKRKPTKRVVKVVKGFAILQGEDRITPPSIEFTSDPAVAEKFRDVWYKITPATLTYYLPPKTT